MKHILFICASIMSIASYAADAADTYIPLERISVDEHSDEEERTAVTIKTLFDGGVRSVNQTLNISKRELTSVHDLPRYRNTLELANLTALNASKNNLGSNDLGTILRTLVQLKTLNMGFNNVTNLATIPSHQHLETLLLNDNKINALNVADCFRKLSRLRRGAFRGNKLIGESITNVTGSYPSITALWFDYDAITERLSGQFIQVCPNLTCELRVGSNSVQEWYSKTEQQWDDCRECTGERDFIGCCTYCALPIIGGIFGLGIAGIIVAAQGRDVIYGTTTYAAAIAYNGYLLGKYCAIFVPVGVVLPPLVYRIGKTINNYCHTKPEDRYVTIPTRVIAAEPRLLDLIEDDVETVPDQEQVQGQEEDAA